MAGTLALFLPVTTRWQARPEPWRTGACNAVTVRLFHWVLKGFPEAGGQAAAECGPLLGLRPEPSRGSWWEAEVGGRPVASSGLGRVFVNSLIGTQSWVTYVLSVATSPRLRRVEEL